MKITWDNIDNFKLLSDGRFDYIASDSYTKFILLDSCKYCNEEYFSSHDLVKHGKGEFCCGSCSSKYNDVLRNPIHRDRINKSKADRINFIFYAGLIGSDDIKDGKKIRTFLKRNLVRNSMLYDLDSSLDGKSFITCPILGARLISIKKSYIKNILNMKDEDYPFSRENRSCSDRIENIKRRLRVLDEKTGLTKHQIGIVNGGRLMRNMVKDSEYNKIYRGLPASYNKYEQKLKYIEDIDITDGGYLKVRCYHCKEWMIPTTMESSNRYKSICRVDEGEHNFYCSDECRSNCSVYNRTIWPKGYNIKYDNYRADQPELRQMVLERDGNRCIICGSTENLICHHLEGILYNPIESADMDLCVTLCFTHHENSHSEIGCRKIDMRCVK